ncbi:MAG: DUF4136 domain-containing protein [Bacteroidota bacterium]
MEIIKKTTKIIFLLFLMTLIGCGPRVSTEKLTVKNLQTAYDTFAYLPNASLTAEGEIVEDPVVNQSIIEAINDNLRQKGFELDKSNPDLLVLATMEKETETRTNVNPSFAAFPYGRVRTVYPSYHPYYYTGFYDWYGPSPFFGYDAYTYDYKEGTLIVYLVDRETKRTVWKGAASKAINQTTPEAAQDLINAMFEEFPE